MWKKIYTPLLLVVLLLQFSRNSAYGFLFPNDDSCNSGSICILTKDCPAALKFLEKTLNHNLTSCGFEGDNQLVCCPTVAATTTSTTTEKNNNITELRAPNYGKSKQACDKYANIFPQRISFQIVDGEDAVFAEFPHMVGLGYQSLNDEKDIIWGCGGTLISETFVLTAAHCRTGRNVGPLLKVRMGVIDIHGNGSDPSKPIDFGLIKFIRHPDYNRQKRINDIALIQMNGTAAFNKYVMPACLYQKSSDPFGMVVTGWGVIENAGDSSNILQKAKLISVNTNRCNQTYGNIAFPENIEKTHICATARTGYKDACEGDSGGPLQIQNTNGSSIYTVVGIVSYGKGCGSEIPGVYTRVHSYLSWIEDIVWPNDIID